MNDILKIIIEVAFVLCIVVSLIFYCLKFYYSVTKHVFIGSTDKKAKKLVNRLGHGGKASITASIIFLLIIGIFFE